MYIDGKWHPADSEIVVLVEKLPVVNVKIVDENGNKVHEYNEYVTYGKYDAKAEIPDGYTAVGDVDFAVSVTRGENGRLVSNISEFVVTVKKDSEKPEEPDKPEKPEEPAKPEQPAKPANPDTSGEMPFATAVTPVIAVALMTCVIISGRRKK